MDLASQSSVAVYTVSGSQTRSLPDWLASKHKRRLKHDDEWNNRIELLQDFMFDEASIAIRVSEDGNFLMSTGTYKPQIHVHNLANLSLSFARHTISQNLTFQLLSSDYSKSIHLQEDRRIEIHTPAGLHHFVRLPRFGRDLVYDRSHAEALIPSVGLDTDGLGEVYRLNLERGTFMKSFQVMVGSDEGVERGLQGSIDVGAVNTAAIAEGSHGLYGFGTSIGTVELFDPRLKSRIATLQSQDGECTALEFDLSGLRLRKGTSEGKVSVYDLRSPKPLWEKDQGYGYPIKKLLSLHTSSQEPKILSLDKRAIKIFEEQDGALWTSIEPAVDLNDVAWCPNSGLLLTANETSQQHAFFLPSAGPAPKWCYFLENILLEADQPRETFDNYKFLTMPELKSLCLAHLVGKTSLMRPYMHGYFVSSKLYDQARLIANPYVWEEERMKRVKERVEQERASRIRGNKKVKVNQKLVDKLLKRQENREKVDPEAGLLGDQRFKALFENEEFVVDENSREFRALNPSTQVEGQAETGNAGNDPMDEESDPSEEEGSNDRVPAQNSGNGVVMRVSSSTRKYGAGMRDTALGSRTQNPRRIIKSRQVGVVGERQVTFVPEPKKQQRPPPVSTPKGIGSRRSASTNTFRKL